MIFNNNSKKIFLTAVCLIAGLFISFSIEGNKKNTLAPFYFITNHMQSGFIFFNESIENTFLKYLNLITIKETNYLLKEENLKLKAQLEILRELQTENNNLHSLLDFKKKSPLHLLSAKIIGRDLMLNQSLLTINKGTEDGLKKFMGVISKDGVVGYLIEVFESHSKVLLIKDRFFTLNALIQRSRIQGIVKGYGGSAYLKYLNRDSHVIRGDLIVTNGLYNNFPKGIPIGIVHSVKKEELKLIIKMEPFVKENYLEKVFVIKNLNKNNR